MTVSQISSSKQELSSEATSENKLESVNNLKAFVQFQGQSTEVEQCKVFYIELTEKTAFQMSSNKQELSSKAMPNMKLELVDNLNASLQFQGTEDEKEQTKNITASQNE